MRIRELLNFDAEICKIEEEIINFMLKLPLFTSKDQIFVKLFGYFITRQYLTQDLLKDLTGLSAGKISQELNGFLEMGLIKRKRSDDSKKYIYYTDTASKFFLKFTKSILENTIKWEQEFNRIISELEENKKNLEKLEGFNPLYEVFTYFISIIGKYQKGITLLDGYMKELD